MSSMTSTQPYPVEGLWVDTVFTGSVSADWDVIGGEYREGFTSYEAPSCPTCDEYAVWHERTWTCGNGACEDAGVEVEDDSEGPMMNYYYPLPDLRRVGDDPGEAASRIRDLPLCVIEFPDGSYALALTGGGMDLSWEICLAFTRLGFLPPLHFADLPAMAGYPRGDEHRYTISACLRSTEVAEARAQRIRETLARLSA
jgi:hypothetical protein